MIKVYVFIFIFCISYLEGSVKKDMLENFAKMEYMKSFEKLNRVQKIHIENKYQKRVRIYEMAKKDGILDTHKYKQQIELIAKEVAMKMFLKKQKNMIEVSLNEKKRYYESHLRDFTTLHAYTIVRKNKKEIDKYINSLQGVAKNKQFELFTTLAKKYSVHPRASRGGDMGYIGFHTMAKPFGEKAFGLEVGSFTQKAFKTTLGWHVVYVKDKKIKKIDEVSEHIGMILRNKKYKEWFQLL